MKKKLIAILRQGFCLGEKVCDKYWRMLRHLSEHYPVF